KHETSRRLRWREIKRQFDRCLYRFPIVNEGLEFPLLHGFRGRISQNWITAKKLDGFHIADFRDHGPCYHSSLHLLGQSCRRTLRFNFLDQFQNSRVRWRGRIADIWRAALLVGSDDVPAAELWEYKGSRNQQIKS